VYTVNIEWRPDHVTVQDQDDVTSRALACDASIPTCRVVNHAGDIIGDNSLSGTELAAPGQVASCLSSLEMFHHHHEESIRETRQDPEQLVSLRSLILRPHH
jgi:hypothetical protein